MKLLVWSLVFLFLMAGSMEAQQRSSGIDAKGFDRSVRPQDDFFEFVNGEWLKHTPIPDDQSNYGSFTALSDEAQANLRIIIEEAAAAQAEPGTNLQRIGDFYRCFLDEAAIDKRGVAPLQPELAAIDAIADKRQLFAFMGGLQEKGVRTPIALFVSVDNKDSTRYLTSVIQSGITLPDRDYYLDQTKHDSARDALKVYARRLYDLAGLPGGAHAATAILELETALANVHWDRTTLRDAEKRYNKFAVADLGEVTPQLPWTGLFEAAGVGQIEEVNVATPSYFQGLQQIIDETPLDVWKQYLKFHLLDAAAPYLAGPFVDAHFELHSKELGGVPQLKPRWKRAVDTVAGAGAGDFGVLGEAVGEIYVQRHFPPEAKARMDELVQNLLLAYQQSIDELPWMTAATKQRAQEKLAKFTTKIGYPDKWRSYEGLEVLPDDLLGNMMRSGKYEYRRMIDKLGKPVDREEWGMTPHTVNAYYRPTMNEIVFPAAILQPPFFTVDADDAVNYGGIGAVIGHEISHGFDDQGSKYDGDGNLSNWWTDEDRAAFTKLTSQLVSQYEGYEPLPGRRVNGQLTLGENIADLSGMSIAYKAYVMSQKGQQPPVIDDWTGDQRFFLGWGQVWRRKYREPELMRRLLTDPHSPASFRGNGPLTNIDVFYTAFDVKPGDRMYKPAEERIRIW